MIAPPVTLEGSSLREYREDHPLARVFPFIDDILGSAAEECGTVMAVGDARGQLLWVSGRHAVLRRAERLLFTEGALWDEEHVGTNGPGMALRLDAHVTVQSAEHFVFALRDWTCTAAPVHDPYTGEILGLVDITGSPEIAGSPQTIAMVRAVARMAEAELGRPGVLRRPVPRSAAEPEIRLNGLGVAQCSVGLGGQALRLSPRHSEIMVILASFPRGLTGDELAYMLYPDDMPPVTLRAELVRLRALLGERVLASRPYRLTCDVRSDWAAVAAHVSAENLREALRLYRGPLLPHSESPGVVRVREDLQRQLRAAILAAARPEFLVSWTRTSWGADDVRVWRRLEEILPAGSPLRHFARATVAKLDAEFGR